MKSDTENITDMFYVGNNNNNKSLTNEPEIKGSWCCNIATCSRVPSGERVSKIAKLSTDTNFDDLKHVYDIGEKAIPVRRKLPRKPKGLNVSRKIRRTFTLCCAHGQIVSSDDDNEENSNDGERKEDEQSLTRADVKNSAEEQNWYVEKRKTESFWKSLLPSPVSGTKVEEQDICSTPVNILQVYAADAYLHITPNHCNPGSNIGDYPVGRHAYVNWQHWDSDVDSTSDDSSSSSDDSFLNSDEFSPFEDDFGSLRSSSEISLVQSDGLLFEYDSDEDKTEVTINTEPSYNKTDIQSVTSNVESIFEEKIEKKSCETPSQPSGSLAYFANRTNPSASFNLSVVAREAESNVPLTNDNAKPQNAYQDISALLDNDNDNDSGIEQVLALVNEMVTSGRIGFKRNVDEPDDDNECFTIDIKHASSGLPYDQVKRLTCRISDLINKKHVQFVHSNNPDSSPWFTVTSYSGSKLILRQEKVITQSNEEEQTSTECEIGPAHTFSERFSNCKEKNMKLARDRNCTEDKISNRLRSESSVPEPLRNICDGKFSSVLDELRKCDLNDEESATEFINPQRVVEEVPKDEDVCYMHLNINDERFVPNGVGKVLVSENGCVASSDKYTGVSSDEMVPVQLNEIVIGDEHDLPFKHRYNKPPTTMQIFTEGIRYGIKKTLPGKAIGKEIIAPLETTVEEEFLQNQPDAGGIEKNETGTVSKWRATDLSSNPHTLSNIPDQDMKLSDSNKSIVSSVIKTKRNDVEDDEENSIFSFVESSLPKPPESPRNEKLLSKRLDTDMADASRSTCMDNKAMSLTKAAAPGCVKAKENSNRPKLRDRHALNRLVIPTDNFPLHTRNKSYHISRTFAAAEKFTGVTKGVSSSTLFATQLSKTGKDPTETTSSYAASTERSNRKIKTAKRRLKNVPKVERDELAAVQAKNEEPLSSAPIQSKANPSTVSLQSKVAPTIASEELTISPSKVKVARSSAPVQSTTVSTVSSTIPIQSKAAPSTASEKSKAISTKASKQSKACVKNVSEKTEDTPKKAPEQTDPTPSKVRSKATRSKSKLRTESPLKVVPEQPEIVATAEKLQQETAPSTVSEQTEVGQQQQSQNVDHLQPLHFIDTDVDATTNKVEEAPPVYLVTDATIDYGRCVVEPGHGERPDKKKLRAEIKEKVKTKGEANKHLKAEKENNFPMYDDVIDDFYQDESYDLDDSVNFENTLEEEEEGARAASPVVLNAVDQPQVLDDREIKMVPETIKRVDDPYLADVEEEYRVSSGCSNKKEKRKQKDARKREKRAKKTSNTIFILS